MRAAILVGAALVLTLAPAGIARGECISEQTFPAARDWCFSEIPRLLFDQQLEHGRIPLIHPCETRAAACDEYPLLTQVVMYGIARVTTDATVYYGVGATILAASAVGSAWILFRLVGRRAMFFALAPTLFIYGFVNWDLLAVFAMCVAIAAHLRVRDRSSGIAIGVGTSLKLMPAAFLPGFLHDALHTGGRASRLTVWCMGTWIALNLPFAVGAWGGWSVFFTFNGARPPDRDSLWFVGCRLASGDPACIPTPWVNMLSVGIMFLVAHALWLSTRRRNPHGDMWTFGFVIMVVFFLTNKVYSPQYDLYLLPWFALALPNVRLFALFQGVGISIALVRFQLVMASPAALDSLLLLRALILIACLAAYLALFEEGQHVAPEHDRGAPSVSV